MFQLECLLDEQPFTIRMHYMNECIMCYRPLQVQSSTNDSPQTLSEESLVTVKHTTKHWPLQCMPCNLHSSEPQLIAQVLESFTVPLKADRQTSACSSENHDNDHSLMPSQDARSDDYAPRTPHSEECQHPTKVGSKHQRSFHYCS